MKTSQPKICKKNNQFTKICEDFSEEYLWKQSIHLQLFAFLLLRRLFSCPVCFFLIRETNSQARGIYCKNTAKKGGNFCKFTTKTNTKTNSPSGCGSSCQIVQRSCRRYLSLWYMKSCVYLRWWFLLRITCFSFKCCTINEMYPFKIYLRRWFFLRI